MSEYESALVASRVLIVSEVRVPFAMDRKILRSECSESAVK